MCCTFPNNFIWIKPWSWFSAFTITTLKKLFQPFWSCSIILSVLIYVKEWKNIKVQHNIELWRTCAYVAIFETDEIYCFIYFASSYQSQTVDWNIMYILRDVNPSWIKCGSNESSSSRIFLLENDVLQYAYCLFCIIDLYQYHNTKLQYDEFCSSWIVVFQVLFFDLA